MHFVMRITSNKQNIPEKNVSLSLLNKWKLQQNAGIVNLVLINIRIKQIIMRKT